MLCPDRSGSRHRVDLKPYRGSMCVMVCLWAAYLPRKGQLTSPLSSKPTISMYFITTSLSQHNSLPTTSTLQEIRASPPGPNISLLHSLHSLQWEEILCHAGWRWCGTYLRWVVFSCQAQHMPQWTAPGGPEPLPCNESESLSQSWHSLKSALSLALPLCAKHSKSSFFICLHIIKLYNRSLEWIPPTSHVHPPTEISPNLLQCCCFDFQLKLFIWARKLSEAPINGVQVLFSLLLFHSNSSISFGDLDQSLQPEGKHFTSLLTFDFPVFPVTTSRYVTLIQ